MAEKLKLEAVAVSKIEYPHNADAGKVELAPGQKLEVQYVVDGKVVGGV